LDKKDADKMKKKIIILIIGLLIILFSGLLYFLSTPAGYIYEWRININLSGYKLIEHYKEKTPTSSVERLQLQKEIINIFIDKTIIQSHEKFILDRKFLFSSLFLPTTSPYPGVITNIIDCAEEFHPKEEHISSGTLYRVSAGDRFNYGICSADLIKYSSIYGIFDCGKKGVIEIRIFSLPQQKQIIEKLISSFRC
jgi:hypothetical protein